MATNKNAFNAGYVKRNTRRVNILRGFDGADPTSFTEVAPIADDEVILSGNLVHLDDGEWKLGCPSGKIPYIALSDGVDTDVSASGLLPAISLAGKFEIEITRYANGVYNESTPLVAGTGGDAGLVAAGAYDGTADILGQVTKPDTDLNAGTGPVYVDGEFQRDSSGDHKHEVMTDDTVILTFVSNWQPLNEASAS